MKELLEQLELLLKEEITDATAPKLELIKSAYEKSKNSNAVSVDDSSEAVQDEIVGDESNPEEDARFKELVNTLQSRIDKNMISKATSENNNLIAKRDIVTQLKELAESPMDSLSMAFKRFNDLKERWRNIGNVPEKHYLALQRDYRFYNEQFFYVIKIFRDLQEHDLKKNAVLKSSIIERLTALAENNNIKELEVGVKHLQNEWDEIGPTLDAEWEKLRDSFKELLNTIYQKIQTHHHQIYESMVSNLNTKNELIAKVAAIVEKEFNHAKSFEDATKEILAIQEEYKKVGFAKKKENEEAWNKFRDLCNSFFDRKKSFYEQLKSKYEVGNNAKQALIQKAEALKDSTDWAIATQKIIGLQKEWKDAPSAGYQTDNKLWEQFRAICDHFFAMKKNHFESQINEEQENLNKKLQLLARIQNFNASDDVNNDLAQIDAFKKEWSSIGFVPRNEKEKIGHLYDDAIKACLKKLKVDAAQLEEIKFNSLVSNIKTNPAASDMMRAERMKLKEELNKLENSISQKENNLLFFAKSKNANSLLDDVKAQLEKEKQTAQALKDKIKKLQ